MRDALLIAAGATAAWVMWQCAQAWREWRAQQKGRGRE